MSTNLELSTLVARSICEKYPFEWVKYSMFHVKNRYGLIPRLYFRLADIRKYDKLKECIEKFSGKISWTLYKYPFSRKENYVIAPRILFEIESDDQRKDHDGTERKLLSDDENRRICDAAIGDIPKLAEHIRNWD